MAKYLTKFTDQAAYEAGDKQYPNVSLLDNGEVKYMAVKPPYQGKALLTLLNGTKEEVSCNKGVQSKLRRNDFVYTYDDAYKEAEVGICTTILGVSVFENKYSLTSVTLPDSLITIEQRSFQGCSGLTNINIPNNVTSIDGGAFNSCYSLASINIPNSVTSIGGGAFQYCSGLTTVDFAEGSNLTSIDNNAFQYCSGLTNVELPVGLSSIGGWSFDRCSGLISVVIPATIQSIDLQAFANCSGLQSITVLATTPPTLGDYAFIYTANAPIFVPAESVEAYKSAPNWNNYSSRIMPIQ